MRVAIVGDYPLNTNHIWGGVEAAFAYLVRELARCKELELHIITLGDPARAREIQAKLPQVNFHILPPFPRLEFARNFRSYQKTLDAALMSIRPDVVHAQGGTDHAYVALRAGYPTVITVHGVQSEDSKYQGTLHQRARKWFYSRLIERYNLSHTRHLIAISQYVTQYFAPLLRRDISIYYIPNAIDDSFFRLPRATRGKTILYAGRVIRRKRALDLVRAFARVAHEMPGAQLLLAGEYHSEPNYVEQVRNLIRQEKLERCVHLLGGLSEQAILHEFAQCDVLALPSVQETTPMVIAQAMAAGKPVIATRVGGIPEMIQDGRTGFLVRVGAVEDLEKKLLCLLKDDCLQKEMGQAARLFAQENYHAEAVAQKTYRAYTNIGIANPIPKLQPRIELA